MLSVSDAQFVSGVSITCEAIQVLVQLRDIQNYDFISTHSSEYVKLSLVSNPNPAFVMIQDVTAPQFYDHMVGIALDGIPMYSGLSASGCDVFDPNCNFTSFSYLLDGCGGSYGPTSSGWRYHYRTAPTCLHKTVAEAKDLRRIQLRDVIELLDYIDISSGPQLLGYSLSGRAIYSPLTDSNTAHDGLDNCNGKVVNGTYSYFSTFHFPYLVGCEGPGVYFTGTNGAGTVNPQLSGQCPIGTYKDTSASFGCLPCAAGKYATSNSESSVGSCLGLCPAGYYCPTGSVQPIPCPGGTYGATTGLGTHACSGRCSEGYFCPTGSTSPQQHPCGNTTFYCPEGSAVRMALSLAFFTTPEDAPTSIRTGQEICRPGYYCVDGVRLPCAAGRYGAVSGLHDSACSGACPEGHYCPLASVEPSLCPAGTYGSVTGLKDESCSGLCNPGYFCERGSTSPNQTACRGGIYGSEYGLTTSQCSKICEKASSFATSTFASASANFQDDHISSEQFCVTRFCEAGYTCPQASTSPRQATCGGPDNYCPTGSVQATPVTAGYYSVGLYSFPNAVQSDTDSTTRTAQVQCEPGYWCDEGVRHACSPGRYGATAGLVNGYCTGACNPGFICSSASSSAQQYHCGLNSSVYCPEGSFESQIVPAGYYSEGGTETTRQYITACSPGMYCVGGIQFSCPAGRYSINGSSTPDCDGLCSAGYYCPTASTSPTQKSCPAGRFGTPGMTSSTCAGACNAGFYCPTRSTSPYQYMCLGDTLYCPRGSGAPQSVATGYYSTGGTALTRTSQALCNVSTSTGTPPAGSHRINICPSTTV